MHPSEIVKDIDFGAVGSTDLEPLDFKSAILKEKLSVMLFAKCCSTSKTAPDNLLYSEFRHPYIEDNSLILFTIEVRIPVPVPIPGVKLGLANIVTVWAVFLLGAKALIT